MERVAGGEGGGGVGGEGGGADGGGEEEGGVVLDHAKVLEGVLVD